MSVSSRQNKTISELGPFYKSPIGGLHDFPLCILNKTSRVSQLVTYIQYFDPDEADWPVGTECQQSPGDLV